jgi:hypothetical protein
MPNAIRSVRAALACSEGEIGEIPGFCPRPLTGVVPTGTAPSAVRDLVSVPRPARGTPREVG